MAEEWMQLIDWNAAGWDDQQQQQQPDQAQAFDDSMRQMEGYETDPDPEMCIVLLLLEPAIDACWFTDEAFDVATWQYAAAT